MSGEPPERATADTRKLAAIMFTDMVGFSRQMGADEARMLRVLAVHNQIIEQAVAEHHGLVIKTIGDAFLVDFPSVVNAVQCAQRVQDQFHHYNAEKEPTEQIHVRIGIHLGDIVQREGDVFGDGVNVASRLQALAEADTICISHVVYQEVEKKLSLGTVVSLGRPRLKNIAQRLPVYALLPKGPRGFQQTVRVQRLKLKQWRRTLQVAVAVLLVGAGVLVKALYFPAPPALPFPDKPSIVVLPFMNMSNDPTQEYFSDGITEDLTTDLSKISSLFVISRNSAFTYKGKAAKVQDVSHEMGVRYVLEGSIRKASDQVRVTAQLIDGTTGGHLWSERYDRPLADIFALQDEIRREIITALKIKLLPEEQKRFQSFPTDNVEAYDYLLRGWEFFGRFTKEGNEQAQRMFEKAIELDPTYASAYAAVGMTYWQAWLWQWNPNPQALQQAFERAQKAVSLNDSLAQAHQVLGQVYFYKKQHEQAIAELERAIASDPNYADGYANLGIILAYAGRPEEGIGWVEKAMRLNPRPPIWYSSYLATAYRLAGRTEEAITTFKGVTTRTPQYLPPHIHLAAIYSELGREEEARAEVAEILTLNPNFSLEGVKQRWPFKDSTVLERYLAALRKAGLK